MTYLKKLPVGKKQLNYSITSFSDEGQNWMRDFYLRLSEKDKRSYAALEAQKIKHGGITTTCKLFGCCRDTVRKGMKELKKPSLQPPKDRVRHKGGGRIGVLHENKRLEPKLNTILKDTIAGDPMNSNIVWTYLNADQIKDKLAEQGISIAENTVRGLLKMKKFVKRKAQKRVPLGRAENRDKQFCNIKNLIDEYKKTGNPVISVDTKKKEQLGNLYRDGSLYVQAGQELIRWDHDFSWLSEGVIVPHGIFDLFNNTAYVNIGTSKETSEFACDSIRRWWKFRGRYDWAGADSILMLTDSGGSNSYRSNLFKEDLQRLVDVIGIEIRMAHYPPYSSKWNYIEHRVFPHITRALSGVVFESHEIFKALLETTKTKKGLRVRANIINREYQIGRETSAKFYEEMPIWFDDYLPDWNYTAIPRIKW